MKQPYENKLARYAIRRQLALLTRHSKDLRACYRNKRYKTARLVTHALSASTKILLSHLTTLINNEPPDPDPPSLP